MAAIKFYSPRQRLRWHFPSICLHGETKATALQIANTSPIATFRLLMQLLQRLSLISRSSRTPWTKKDLYYCSSLQTAGKETCDLSSAAPGVTHLALVLLLWRPAGQGRANKPLTSCPPVAEAPEMQQLACLRR